MARTLFRNVTVWDGSGAAPFPGDVLVEGNRIRTLARKTGELPGDGALQIDGGGMTLMPGMVEGHAHLSFGGAQKNSDLGDIPPEEHTLLTMRNAKTLLDHGFTSAYSAASAKLRLDVVIRNEINAGRLPGPRLRAAGPELTVTAGLGDENRLHMLRDSFALVVDGPEEIAKATRICIREGADNIKINISGDDFVPAAKGGMTVMREAEVLSAVEVAHSFGKRVNSHSHSSGSVKRAVECGVDVIYHCEAADSEALDLLEAAKDRIFVGPAIGLIYNTLYEGEAFGITKQVAHDLGMHRVIDSSQRAYAEMRKRGIPVVIGGDYGFAWVPQGTNARDIAHFVSLFGYSPSEALQCATRVGGAIMGLGHELGLVKEGYLADLLLVAGDPLKDVTLLQHQKNLVVIMQDGRLYKDATASLE
ncbi:MAG: amidohydrolase family protein, partial [Stellaceae bacterium]